MSIKRVFAKARRAQLSGHELESAGIARSALDRAVRSGALRQGVMGYWLPVAADPGALLVFGNARNQNEKALRQMEAS